MPIHLAYIMLFSYFCVACKNSEFCYHIFSYDFFDFSLEDCSMCESYTIRKPQNAIYEKPAKTRLHTSLFFCVIALCDTQKCVLHVKCKGLHCVYQLAISCIAYNNVLSLITFWIATRFHYVFSLPYIMMALQHFEICHTLYKAK